MTSPQPIETDTLVLNWRVHLLKRDPSRLPVVLLAAAFGGGCIWVMFRNPFPAWVAMLLVLGSVSEYLLPITYHINSEGAKARFGLQPASIRWSEVRRVVHRRGGVLLSPLSEPSRLDGFRGVYLRFGRKGEAGQRLEVLSAIRAYLPQLEEKSTETTPALQGAIES